MSAHNARLPPHFRNDIEMREQGNPYNSIITSTTYMSRCLFVQVDTLAFYYTSGMRVQPKFPFLFQEKRKMPMVLILM